MARKRPKPEEIVAKLRQVDVLTARGKSICASNGCWVCRIGRRKMRCKR